MEGGKRKNKTLKRKSIEFYKKDTIASKENNNPEKQEGDRETLSCQTEK